MVTISLQVSGLAKAFNRRKVFSNISIVMRGSDSLTVTGRNGSGKSTLLKILAGLLSPSRGSIDFSVDEDPVSAGLRYRYIGFVAPYLQLYDEFSALENLEFFRKVRGLDVTRSSVIELLERLNLADRGGEPLRTFSSGMKQRLKYVFALLHRPPVLLLDEPSSNLDAEGIDAVQRIVADQKRKGIVVIATNNAGELDRSDQLLDLDRIAGRSSMPV